ncbi:MAG TPA: hypothetical protein VEO00_10850 [Actinomycetota bacterium]|nr:hypothetical protein [Actinomycetota bacterium]
MRKRIVIALVAALAIGLVGVGMGVGSADVSTPTITIRGEFHFEPNQYIESTQRFVPGIIFVKSGGHLTVRNRDGVREPHTFSIVRQGDVPKTFGEAFGKCFVGACGKILARHGAEGPKTDNGTPGLDGFGDSIILLPGRSVEYTVTAPPGTALYFLCAFHPWMQGRINIG